MSTKTRKMIPLICLYVVYSGLNGCASISSEIVCSNPPHLPRQKSCDNEISLGDGIVYYLPKRSIRVNVAVTEFNASPADSSANESSTVSTTTSPSQNVSIDIKSAAKQCETKKTPPKDTYPKTDSSEDKKVTEKKVTVTIVNNYATETIPDPGYVFLLRYNKNWIGANNMAIGVNSYGLLSVTHADTVNKINDIAANIAVDVAAVSLGAGFSPQADAATRTALQTFNVSSPELVSPSNDNSVTFSTTVDKCKVGRYSILFDPTDPKLFDRKNPNQKISKPESVCGIDISVERIFGEESKSNHRHSYRISPAGFWDEVFNWLTKAKSGLDIFHANRFKFESLPGLFYKQDLPYIVTVQQKTQNSDAEAGKMLQPTSSFLALSPNESKIYFAPITETLFSDNTSDITLVNGIVNTLKENTDSELLALTKIPSGILGAYTNAAGQIFSSVGKVLDNQHTSQASELSVLLGAEKIKRCQLAIAINNPAGKTGDALTIAFNNIQTACGN